ncbi:MAG TPA: hypothetical protein VK983_05555 [Candidatus Limnocylindrales bacterium]|nr:hypothetical protein [Candidatus Limnocylindrales bacterium]
MNTPDILTTHSYVVGAIKEFIPQPDQGIVTDRLVSTELPPNKYIDADHQLELTVQAPTKIDAETGISEVGSPKVLNVSAWTPPVPKRNRTFIGTSRSYVGSADEQFLLGNIDLTFNSKRVLSVKDYFQATGNGDALVDLDSTKPYKDHPLILAARELLQVKATRPQTLSEYAVQTSFFLGHTQETISVHTSAAEMAAGILETTGKAMPNSVRDNGTHFSVTHTTTYPYGGYEAPAQITTKLEIDEFHPRPAQRVITGYTITQYDNYSPSNPDDHMALLSGIQYHDGESSGFSLGIDVDQHVLYAGEQSPENSYKKAETPAEARMMIKGLTSSISKLRRYKNQAGAADS